MDIDLHKYLKYKNKYLTLLKLTGGDIGQIIRAHFYPIKVTQEGMRFIIDCELISINYSSFTVEQKYIYIGTINNCGDRTGTIIVEKIKQLGKILGKEYISLSDGSTIDFGDICNYSLSAYKILQTGESWYNKLGFYSKYHEEDLTHNRAIRELPLGEFIIKATIAYKFKKKSEINDTIANFSEEESEMSSLKLKKKQAILSKYGSLEAYKTARLAEIDASIVFDIDNFLRLYSDFEITTDMPIGQIIIRIDEHVKTLYKSGYVDKIRSLKSLIDISEYLISYDGNLKYNFV